LGQRDGPLGLRLQPRQRLLDQLASDPSLLEVEADRLVAVPARRECFGA
jgi:hypothetical protein